MHTCTEPAQTRTTTMRVGILTDAFPPTVGGMEIFAGQYTRKLAVSKAIESVDVLAFQSGKNEQDGSLSIQRMDVDGTIARLRRGLMWARAGRYNVVHSLTLYPSGLTAALTNRFGFADRCFVTVYGTDALGAVNHPIHRSVRRFAFQNVNEVLFFSNSTREKTHEAYDNGFKSRTVYPGRPTLPPATEGFKPPATDGSFVVVTVCRLVKRKSIDDLIGAIQPLSDVALWIVGDGPERGRLEEMVAERGIAERVAFVGEVPHDAIEGYYRAADLFCMPSVHLGGAGDVEGLGLVFLEAQQMGLPVVGTDSGGIPEAIADGKSGFVVPESSPEAIREAIRTLRADPKLYEDYSENARTFVERRFSWDRCVEDHLNAYRDDR